MKKSLLALIFISKTIYSQTSNETISGSSVNYWTQAGLLVSERPMDLAIQGKGFFILQTEHENWIYTRNGVMGQDAQGFLIHQPSQYRLLGICNGESTSINLSRYAKHTDGTVAKSFRVNLNGQIEVFYENGKSHKICSIGLALFRNPNMLKRSRKHLLKPSLKSGKAYVGLPLSEGRGSIYASSLEELSEQIYRLNIHNETVDRVSEEIEKNRLAMEHWNKEKTDL